MKFSSDRNAKKKCKNSTKLRNHIRRMHTNNPMICDLCGKVSKTKYGLIYHMEACHPQQCVTHNQLMKKKCMLADHMKANHDGDGDEEGEIVYVCACLCSYNSVQKLRRHWKQSCFFATIHHCNHPGCLHYYLTKKSYTDHLELPPNIHPITPAAFNLNTDHRSFITISAEQLEMEAE